MTSLLATAIALAFTVVVCLVVLRALLDTWLGARRPSAAAADTAGDKQTPRASQTRGAAPIHSA